MYLRKSRADLEAEKHGEGETLARHESALNELARRRGLAIACVYREVVSGETIAARPIMQQLLEEVEQGCWQGVLVMDIDRLARGDSIDQGIIARAFKYSGTQIFTPMKTYDPDNEFDEEFFEFGLFMSRREYKMINRRLQRGRLASVQEGKYVGSLPPYGYRKIKLEREKGYTLAPVEEQAEVVRTMYHWYVNGLDGVRIGASAIAHRLTSLGIRPPQTDTWSPSTVRDILNNPVYTGKIRWNWRKVETRMREGRQVSSRPRASDYDLIPGLHPAIIDEELWQSARKLAKEKNVPKTPSTKVVQNPLSGLIVCGICGKRMVRKPYKGSSKDSILCPTPRCASVSSTLESVERQLLHSLSQWLQNCRVLPESHAETGTKATLLEHLYKNLREAEQQKARAHDLLELEVYNTDTFFARTKELDARIGALQKNIAEMQAALELDIQRERRNDLLPAAVHILESYHRAGTPAEKNALLKEVVDRAVYKRENSGRGQGFDLHIFPKLNACGQEEPAKQGSLKLGSPPTGRRYRRIGPHGDHQLHHLPAHQKHVH